MARHLMLVFANPLPGREDEFHTWYDQVHLPEMLAIPGFVGAQRYDVTGLAGGPDAPHRFAAVYEMECDDPQEAYRLVTAAAAEGRLQPGDAMAPDISLTFLTPR